MYQIPKRDFRLINIRAHSQNHTEHQSSQQTNKKTDPKTGKMFSLNRFRGIEYIRAYEARFKQSKKKKTVMLRSIVVAFHLRCQNACEQKPISFGVQCRLKSALSTFDEQVQCSIHHTLMV